METLPSRNSLLSLFEQAPPALQERWQAARTDRERSACVTALAKTYQAHDMTLCLQLGDLALDLAMNDSSPEAAVEALLNMGWASVNLGHHLRAAEHCAQAMHLVQEHHLPHLEAHALNIRALSRMMAGDESGARRDFKRALRCAPLSRTVMDLLRTYVNSAWFYTTCGLPSRSLYHLSLLEEELQKLGDPETHAYVYALMYENRAHAVLVQAEQVKALGREDTFRELLEQAAHCVTQCFEVLERHESPYIRMLNQIHDARVWRLRGDLIRAEASALQALKYTEVHDLGLYPEVHLALAEIRMDQQKWPEALDAYERGLAIMTGQGRQRQVQQTLLSMALMYERMGDLALALTTTRQAVDVAQQSIEQLSREEASLFDARYDTGGEELLSWQERLQSAEFLARQDELTRLLNRRGLEAALQRLLETHPGNREMLVAFLDIDFFKNVNDRFSHAVGDQVLRQCASLLKQAVPPDALLSRYGGEEFVLIAFVPDDTPHLLPERCRQAIETHDWYALMPDQSLTISIGYTCGPLDQVSALLHTADEYLYQAKRTGRNRVYPPVPLH